jgi:hypothetical protein
VGTGFRAGRGNRDYILSSDKNFSVLQILQTGSVATRLPILGAPADLSSHRLRSKFAA